MKISKMKNLRSSKGFTIVELLIVIIVIAILATLVITAYNGVQAKARDVKRQTDAKSVQKAAEAYYADNGSYPTTQANFTASGNTVKLDSTIDITQAPSSSQKDAIGVYACGTNQGDKITYWSEQSAAAQTIYAGSSSSCAATVIPAS